MTDDKLPAGALLKIFSLKDQERQAQTLMTANQRQIGELQRAIGINPHGDQAEAFQIELDRLQGLQAPHQSRHKAIADLNAQLEHFLALLPVDVEIEDAKRVRPKLKPGETHRQVVDRLRDEIVGLITERGQVERAALPADEIKAQAKKWITERALKARPAITATHEKFDVKFTLMDGNAYTPVLDTLALVAWFDPEHMEARLNELIDQMPKPQLALTPAKKTERLASIRSQLFDLERLECAHIEAAMDEGTIIPHRPNVDPQALLGIVIRRDQVQAA
jgi:hypothetical protein